MDTSAFVTSLLTSLVIFLLLLLLHAVLSRRASNYPIYYPALLLRRASHPEEAQLRSPTAWLREALLAKEGDIVNFAGLDAAVYIRLQDAALKILGLTALFCVPVLVTVSALSDGYEQQRRRATDDNKLNSTYTGFDKLAMGNIPDGSNKIWVFVIGAYWLSLVTYLVLWRSYAHVAKLRCRELSSPKAQPEQFAVLVRDIPVSTEAEVDEYLRQLHPDSYLKCIVAPDLRRTDKLWRARQDAESKLARCGRGSTHRTGIMGLCGPAVDSEDFYTSRLRQLDAELEEERAKARARPKGRQRRAAIAIFSTRLAAAAAAQSSHSPSGGAWLTCPAPEPREVLWANLHVPLWSRVLRRLLVYSVVALTILFYMVPIGFVSALTTLDNLKRNLPFLKPVVNVGPVKTVLQAYLPQLALIVFLALLPKMLLYLSKLEGIASRSQLERAASGKYFYFNVLNIFLGVTLASSLFNTLKDLQKSASITKVVQLFGGSIPFSASFFITFIALKFFVGFGLRFSRLVPLVIFRLKKKYLCKTEEDVAAAWKPSPLGYHTSVPGDMLVLVIAVCYAVIAPMVLPFALAYFAISWLVARHEALKVVVPTYESNGRMWPHMHSRMVAALLVSQIAMLGYFSIKRFVFTAMLAPLPIATIIFYFASNKVFYRCFEVTPLEVASVQPKEAPTVTNILDAYTPESLRREAKDEEQPPVKTPAPAIA